VVAEEAAVEEVAEVVAAVARVQWASGTDVPRIGFVAANAIVAALVDGSFRAVGRLGLVRRSQSRIA
jgi:hypothetical protein